jgi:hypothetical protein
VKKSKSPVHHRRFEIARTSFDFCFPLAPTLETATSKAQYRLDTNSEDLLRKSKNQALGILLRVGTRYKGNPASYLDFELSSALHILSNIEKHVKKSRSANKHEFAEVYTFLAAAVLAFCPMLSSTPIESKTTKAGGWL